MTVSHPSIPPAVTRSSFATLVGRDVSVHTACGRHRGTLLAVSSHAVWLELRDDCMLAITEPVLAVTPGRAGSRSDPAPETPPRDGS